VHRKKIKKLALISIGILLIGPAIYFILLKHLHLHMGTASCYAAPSDLPVKNIDIANELKAKASDFWREYGYVVKKCLITQEDTLYLTAIKNELFMTTIISVEVEIPWVHENRFFPMDKQFFDVTVVYALYKQKFVPIGKKYPQSIREKCFEFTDRVSDIYDKLE